MTDSPPPSDQATNKVSASEVPVKVEQAAPAEALAENKADAAAAEDITGAKQHYDQHGYPPGYDYQSYYASYPYGAYGAPPGYGPPPGQCCCWGLCCCVPGVGYHGCVTSTSG